MIPSMGGTMRYLKQWAFTVWWVLAVVAFVAGSKAGMDYSSNAAVHQFAVLQPAWGFPYMLPLGAIRALNVPGGVPYNFELALILGLLGCLLVDLIRHRRTASPKLAHSAVE
jgi:hypothetical protein